jgi:hypothetical protein
MRHAKADGAKRARMRKDEDEDEYDDCSDGVGELQSVLVALVERRAGITSDDR